MFWGTIKTVIISLNVLEYNYRYVNLLLCRAFIFVTLKNLQKGDLRQKGDERILGDSGHVLEVLKQAQKRFERKYELKAKGYNYDVLAERVAELSRSIQLKYIWQESVEREFRQEVYSVTGQYGNLERRLHPLQKRPSFHNQL